MIINTNVAALNSYNQLSQTNNNMQKSLERLSSGSRINRAADDAAGLAISEKMNSQTRGLAQAQRNAQDGISMIQTAEGALKETHSILQRMRELSVQSANDTNTGDDRAEIQKEIDQLSEEITRIGETTEFNTKALLDGDFAGTFQIGANEGQNMEVSVNDMRANALDVSDQATEVTGATTGTAIAGGGKFSIEEFDNSVATGTLTSAETVLRNDEGKVVGYSTETEPTSFTTLDAAVEDDAAASTGNSVSIDFGATQVAGTISLEEELSASGTTATYNAETGINVSTQEKADAAITTLDEAIKTVSAERSKLGAVQNRLDHTINNLSASEENLTAANSRIKDVDMAKEMMNMSKQQILSQAGTAMLAQANQMPQGVLQLLG
ncbi:flagellin N-terminal helical domain-containing protein [Halanaerobium saccharolyticum]|uniref:flagellin N-terminal helical domain-containing protein n=2 Tax=Halanaerobium saccharolyticum TaxID=43595 RepID=UPI000DB94A74|nr:flagellin [Halanaerobium saccharolyticum]RAK08592.1 flagellin [Halanaerobium saccharolyticum]TDX60144.1 flagellin [Halanaerobium saccharolyticum]